MSFPMRYRLASLLAVLAILVGIGIYFSQPDKPDEDPDPVADGAAAVAGDLPVQPGEESDLLPLTELSDAPFAQEFGAPGTTAERELELVQLAFGDYLSFVKERYRKPFGYHEELIALLVGGNPLRVAPVPPGHPRIDPLGRLTDHWGTAFDIHVLSSTAIEIRSAGPDREMHTGDDLHNVTPTGQDILDRMRPVAGRGSDGAGARDKVGGGGR